MDNAEFVTDSAENLSRLSPDEIGQRQESDGGNELQHLGGVFESAYSVLDGLFGCMNARELLKCQLVCKSWKNSIEQVLSRRCKVVSFYRDAASSQPRRRCVDDEFGDYLKSISTVPAFVCALQAYYTRKPSCLMPHHTTSKCSFRRSLPSSCRLLGGAAHLSIYGCKNESWNGNETSLLDEIVDDGICGFIFPKALLRRYDIRIQPIALTVDKQERLLSICDNERNLQTFCSFFDWPPEQKMKCIMLISHENPLSMRCTERLLKWLWHVNGSQPEDHNQIALCGGALSFVQMEHTLQQHSITHSRPEQSEEVADEETASMVGIIFGGNSLNASSFILSKHIVEREDVEKELVQWKKSVIDKWPQSSNRIAFIFNCCARETSLDEASVFRSVFSDIPLCGIRTYGEYGVNAPSSPSQKLTNTRRKRAREEDDDEKSYRKMILTFSTVFAIISFD